MFKNGIYHQEEYKLGAMRIGNYWLVPADAERPKSGRIKSGKQ